MKFPYTYISCPCAGTATSSNAYNDAKQRGEAEEEQEKTFNPRSPRANFSLYPMEHLLYCEDCQQIRCPRCVVEEIVCWYCPSCLFEVTSMMVKNEGNRCQRNCFNCPICVAPMGILNIDPHAEGMSGTFILACDYCRWTTLDIGMHFDRPTKLIEKLAAARKEARTKQQAQTPTSTETPTPPPPQTDPEETFTALKSFMSLQISSAGSTNPLLTPGGSYNYDSPSSLARIMSMYTGQGTYSKKNTSKSAPMRESADPSEGLHVFDPGSSAASIQALRSGGMQSTPTLSQRQSQRFPSHSHSLADLLPVPTLLRTKRAKRCRICRHILVKPDAKVASVRYRIRLIALNYLPTITLKPLPSSLTTTTTPTPSPFPLPLHALPPHHPTQHLLTLRNPLFDALRITLATPSHTPGPHAHRITILCPQFTIGANADAWDEALAADTKSPPTMVRPPTTVAPVAEAGKVWDSGRNWTSVVVEVVCVAVDEGEDEEEDADVLEIPVFVRMEYEVDGEREGEGEGKGGREKRELAFWVVVGVGSVGRGGV